MDEKIETIRGYVNDMLAVERDLHGMLRRHRDDAHMKQYPTASRLMAEAEEIVDRHMEAIEQCADRLGGQSVVKKAAGAAMGAVGAVFEKMRDDRASRMLRDDYTALNFASMCYEMLHTTALAVGDNTVAQLALQHMKDYTPIIVELADTVPEVVVRELAQEGKVSESRAAVEQAKRNTRAAWEQASSHT